MQGLIAEHNKLLVHSILLQWDIYCKEGLLSMYSSILNNKYHTIWLMQVFTRFTVCLIRVVINFRRLLKCTKQFCDRSSSCFRYSWYIVLEVGRKDNTDFKQQHVLRRKLWNTCLLCFKINRIILIMLNNLNARWKKEKIWCWIGK